MSTPYALPPDQLTPLQRAEEVVSILARAILRAQAAAEKNPPTQIGLLAFRPHSAVIPSEQTSLSAQKDALQ